MNFSLNIYLETKKIVIYQIYLNKSNQSLIYVNHTVARETLESALRCDESRRHAKHHLLKTCLDVTSREVASPTSTTGLPTCEHQVL